MIGKRIRFHFWNKIITAIIKEDLCNGCYLGETKSFGFPYSVVIPKHTIID